MESICFGYSAFLSMLTHVIWDSFTHQNGLMVTKLRVLTQTYTFFGYQIPIYKFLQHGSTLFGIVLIFGYVYYRATLGKDKKYQLYRQGKTHLLEFTSCFNARICMSMATY